MATRTIRPIRVDGAIAYVPLTKGLEAVIDAADLPLVEGRNWSTSGWAAVAWGTNRRESMHRIIMNAQAGVVVDHIDGNPLHNRRSNLRVTTHSGNMKNRKIARSNKCGMKGVYWDNERELWRVEIRSDGRKHKVGRFSSLQQAAAAYDAAAVRLHGEFARLNFPAAGRVTP